MRLFCCAEPNCSGAARTNEPPTAAAPRQVARAQTPLLHVSKLHVQTDGHSLRHPTAGGSDLALLC